MKRNDSCRLFDIALAAVMDAVVAVDADDAITYMNSSAEALTGWRASEALGKPLTQVCFLVDEETDRVIERPLDEAAPGTGPSAAAPVLRDAALVNRRGIQVGIEYHVLTVRDRRGRRRSAVLVARTRRQAAELALQSSNESALAHADALFEERERAQVTLDSIGDAVISTDFSGRVRYLNGVAEKIIGWEQAAATGNAVDDIFRLIDTNSREIIPCPTAQAIIDNRKVALQAVSLLDRNDTELAVEVSASPIHDRHGGVVGAVMVAHDVTAAREFSLKLARLALHDSLTDLPNRALFEERLGTALTQARASGAYAALLYVDLDGFKGINDSLGHATGDKLLQTVARRLLGCVRSSDTVSRQGGDEFVVLLPEIARIRDAAACAEKILAAVDAPFRIADRDLKLTASVGVSIFPDDAADADSLLKCADLAMYQAKYNGRNSYRWFTPGEFAEAKAT